MQIVHKDGSFFCSQTYICDIFHITLHENKIILICLGTSISIRIQKPDIFLFGDLEKNNTHVIRMQTEVFIESSRHGCSSSIVCTLTNVNAKTKGQGNYESPYWLLHPCDVEISKKKELSSGNEEIVVAINSIDIQLSAEVIHTFFDVSNHDLS